MSNHRFGSTSFSHLSSPTAGTATAAEKAALSPLLTELSPSPAKYSSDNINNSSSILKPSKLFDATVLNKKKTGNSQANKSNNEEPLDLLDNITRKLTNVTLDGAKPIHAFDEPEGDPDAIVNLFSSAYSINSLVSALHTNVPEYMKQAMVKFRKYLSIDMKIENVYTNIENILSLNLLPRFLELLDFDDAILQYETCWVVTNVAAGTSQHTTFIVESGFLPKLVRLLSHQTPLVRIQAAWALGNIAGDCGRYRDLILDMGVVHPLLRIWRSTDAPSEIRQAQLVAVWTIANLSRWKRVDWGKIVGVLPALRELLFSTTDQEILTETCWALSRIFHGKHVVIDEMIDEALCRKLVDICRAGDTLPSLVNPAIRALTNIASGEDYHTQLIIDADGLPVFAELLSSSNAPIRLETMMAISNIAAGTLDQVHALLESGLFPMLVQMLGVDSEIGLDDYRMKKEAVWALNNAMAHKYYDHAVALVDAGIIQSLLLLATQTYSDPLIHFKTIELISNIIHSQPPAGDLHITQNRILFEFFRCNGPDYLSDIIETIERGLLTGEIQSLHNSTTEFTKSIEKCQEILSSIPSVQEFEQLMATQSYHQPASFSSPVSLARQNSSSASLLSTPAKAFVPSTEMNGLMETLNGFKLG